MNTKPFLDIIIVNWNSGFLLNKCICSIINAGNEELQKIIVVDNASTDESLSYISENNKIEIIRNQINNGFGFACNQGAKLSNSEYILFLNPDTEVRVNTIVESLEFIENNPSINVLGCKQVDKHGTILRTCARFITLSRYFNKLTGLSQLLPNTFYNYHMHEWDHSTSKEVDHVMGSFYLMKREDFFALDLFDEDYFVYLEDLDLSYRVKKKNGKIYFNADIEIYHETGGSSKNVKAKRLYYSLNSLLVYGKKHFSKIRYVILCILVLLVEPFLRLSFNICRLNFKGVKETIIGYKLLYNNYFNVYEKSVSICKKWC